MTITNFDANLYSGTTANYEIYYKAGTHVGFENNASAWIFVGSVASLTSQGNNVPTPLPIPVNVTIPAGARYAFYITNDFGGGVHYSDGTAVGNLLDSNADLKVYEGIGKTYPFGLNYSVRNVNAIIYYSIEGADIVQTTGMPSGSTFSEGTHPIAFLATDNAGNTTVCNFNVEVSDTTSPVLDCSTATDVTIECNASTEPANAGMPTATDNCDGTVDIDYVDVSTQTASGCGQYNYTINRTWTASDESGGSTFCLQVITVEDTTAPSFATCPDNVTVAPGGSSEPSNTGMPTATDNCTPAGVLTFTYDDVETACTAGMIEITRTWTVTDICNNSTNDCIQVITTQDCCALTVTCPSGGMSPVQCGQYHNPANSVASLLNLGQQVSVYSPEECGNVVVSHVDVINPLSICNGRTVTRTYTIANDIESTTCVRSFFINPPSPVTMNCASDITISCNASTAPSNTGQSTAASSCSSASVSYEDVSTQTTSGCGQYNYTIDRTWTATDACGSTTCLQVITVQDISLPTITCPATAILAFDESTDPSNTGMATATDNCNSAEEINVTFSDNTSACTSANITITRTWTATDLCGNNTNCIQTIVQACCNLEVTCPPASLGTITCNDDIPAAATDEASFEALGGDIADNPGYCGTLEVSSVESLTPTDICNGRTLTRTYTVSDDVSSFTCTQTLTVSAPEAPVLDCSTAANVTVECDANTAPVNTGMPTATGDCGQAVVITFSDSDNQASSGCGEYNYTITRTWTATDACGNTSSCDQIITLEDTTAPVIVCPADITLTCDQNIVPGVDGDAGPLATAADACASNSATITYTDVMNPLTVGYSISRTWIATDACGNMSSCEQTITVEECEVEIMDPCACLNNSSVIDLDTDLGGGDGQFSELVSITGPNQGPVNDPNLIYVVTAITGGVDAFLTPPPAPPAQTPGISIPIGTQLVYNTVTMHYELPFYHYDGAGYMVTIQQIVGGLPGESFTVGNNCVYPLPIFSPILESLYCPNGAAVPLVGIDQNGVGADGMSFTINGNPANEFDPSALAKGIYTVVMTFDGADDGFLGISPDDGVTPVQPGCIQEVVQMIEVNDVVAPVIDCPADVALSCDASTDPAATGVATATDNCDLAPIITSEDVSTEGTEGCGQFNYNIERTWTATDACGNFTSCVQMIDVSDTTLPVITCPTDQVLTCFETVPAPITTAAGFIAADGSIADNCTTGLAEFTVFAQDDDNGGNNCPDNARIVVRTYLVQDACGNTSTCEQTFTYEASIQKPVITSILPACYKSCSSMANPMETDITFETDCAFGATVSISGPEQSGLDNCPGTVYTYAYTVTDDCGRISDPLTRDFIIENDGPTITCAPFNLILECGNPDNQEYINTHLAQVTVNTSCDLGNTLSHSPQDFDLNVCGTATVVIFTATDACGRTATCTTTVAVQDNTPPVFTAVPPSICDVTNCSADVNYWYNHWIDYMIDGLEAEDACDSNVSIQAVNTPLNTDCPNGTAETIVTFVATDNCGNEAEITGVFVVEGIPSNLNLMGMIATEMGEQVENVAVTLDGSSTVATMYETGEDGWYGFENLEGGFNYSVTPYSDDNPLNGVTSFDLVLIAQHILQIESLDSPYKMIAADVNNSGSITTMDLLELRKLILHIDDSFVNNNSWRFVEAAFVFPEPSNPFAASFSEGVNINDLAANEAHDFVGVKIGDVNGSVVANVLAGAEDRNFNGTLVFDVTDKHVAAGETFDIEFKAKDFTDMLGYQHALKFDKNQLTFIGVFGDELPNMSRANFGTSFLREGLITTSWHSADAVSRNDGTVLFRIQFQAKQAGMISEWIDLSSKFTKAEGYSVTSETAEINLLEVELRFDESGSTLVNIENKEHELVLYQNRPNPFISQTQISFQLPEAGDVRLNIYDSTRRLVKTMKGNFAKGYNELEIDRAELSGVGVYYCQLMHNGVSKTLNIVVLTE